MSDSPLTSVPAPDDSPLSRLAHTVTIFDEDPRPADDVWVVTATQNAYPNGPKRTGLTWGDLRALYEQPLEPHPLTGWASPPVPEPRRPPPPQRKPPPLERQGPRTRNPSIRKDPQ